jgi:hypothetical protein
LSQRVQAALHAVPDRAELCGRSRMYDRHGRVWTGFHRGIA